MSSISILSQNPVYIKASVPPGHIIVNEKWRKSAIVSSLQGSVTAVYQDEMGVVDFYISSSSGVIYVSESDLVIGSTYKRKLVKLRKNNELRGIVVVEKTETSQQYFSEAQKFCVLELGLCLLPVLDQLQAGQLLSQMVISESRLHNNPFKLKKFHPCFDTDILNAVKRIPFVGETKAKLLLQRFGSIKAIGGATEEDLSAAVGSASARHILQFFNAPTGGAR